MFVSVKCYFSDIAELSEKQRREFYDSKCDSTQLEYDVDLNTDHIISLEESRITFGVEYNLHKLNTKVKTVIATMTNGKQFYIKANSIPELKLKTAIYGNGSFE